MRFSNGFCALASALLLAASGLVVPAAQAQSGAPTPVKFQLDWRFEGPAAFFLLPAAKGYFKEAGLNVTVDAGNGSGAAVQRGIHMSDVSLASLELGPYRHFMQKEIHEQPRALGDTIEAAIDAGGFPASLFGPRAGEVLALTGANGAGKTSLLRAIAGLGGAGSEDPEGELARIAAESLMPGVSVADVARRHGTRVEQGKGRIRAAQHAAALADLRPPPH